MISAYTLKRYPFFANLEDQFVEKIFQLGEIVDLQEEEWLFHQEENATHIYLILEGKIAFTIMFRDHIIDRINPYMRGEMIGWTALVKPHVYTMGAITESPTKVIGFEGKALFELMETDKAQGYTLMRNLTEIISERLINRHLQLMSLRT